ncbi:PorT family protein [Flavobacteriaceae bacterium LYZ1037]|nr:PorT family protein [Flavobacteriaceae bacterium LYZ1037]
MANSQVLLTLLFGDKLNSPDLEFGLEGGVNFPAVSGLDTSSRFSTFNIGFYFDFRVKEQLYIHTGVLVKSKLGVNKLSVSDVQAAGVNYIDENGTYSQKINYFLVPVFGKYIFSNNIFVEAGPEFGLRYKAWVEYENDTDDVETNIRQYNKDMINPIEAGVGIGAGYKIDKVGGMSFGVKYFQGFVNVYKGNSSTKNNSLFLAVTLPIGAKKSHDKIESNNINKPQ